MTNINFTHCAKGENRLGIGKKQGGDSRVPISAALKDVPDPRSKKNPFVDHIYIGGARIYPGHTGSDVNKPSKTIKAETVGKHLHKLLRNDPAVKDADTRNMAYAYPEALNGEQMLLAMERPAKYIVCGRMSKRQRV